MLENNKFSSNFIFGTAELSPHLHCNDKSPKQRKFLT